MLARPVRKFVKHIHRLPSIRTLTSLPSWHIKSSNVCKELRLSHVEVVLIYSIAMAHVPSRLVGTGLATRSFGRARICQQACPHISPHPQLRRNAMHSDILCNSQITKASRLFPPCPSLAWPVVLDPLSAPVLLCINRSEAIPTPEIPVSSHLNWTFPLHACNTTHLALWTGGFLDS